MRLIKLIVICFENNIKCPLKVNKRITVDGIGQGGIEKHDIHGYFCVLTVGQWTPRFWDITDKIEVQSLVRKIHKSCYIKKTNFLFRI